MAPVSRSIICLDFDGVCNKYADGWLGITEIHDGPTDGLREWLQEARDRFRIAIFSSRFHRPQGFNAVSTWWLEHELPSVEFWNQKPPALVHIDDRALTFTGDWNDFPPERLLGFRPWNRR